MKDNYKNIIRGGFFFAGIGALIGSSGCISTNQTETDTSITNTPQTEIQPPPPTQKISTPTPFTTRPALTPDNDPPWPFNTTPEPTLDSFLSSIECSFGPELIECMESEKGATIHINTPTIHHMWEFNWGEEEKVYIAELEVVDDNGERHIILVENAKELFKELESNNRLGSLQSKDIIPELSGRFYTPDQTVTSLTITTSSQPELNGFTVLDAFKSLNGPTIDTDITSPFICSELGLTITDAAKAGFCAGLKAWKDAQELLDTHPPLKKSPPLWDHTIIQDRDRIPVEVKSSKTIFSAS